MPRAVLEFVGQQAASGRRRGRRQLDDHDRLVDTVLARHGGRRAKHTGDGIFALFGGPTKAARYGLGLVPALAVHVGARTSRTLRDLSVGSGLVFRVKVA